MRASILAGEPLGDESQHLRIQTHTLSFRPVTGRHQPHTIPTLKRAELSLARHEYRWTDVEELAKSSREVCADLSLAGENR